MSPAVRIQPANTLDTESALEYVSGNAAPVLRNLLPHKPGRLIQRGGLSNSVAFTTNGVGPVVGPWVFDDKLIFAAPDAGGVTKANLVTMNADGTITYGGGLVAVAYPRLSAYARVGDYVYGPAALAPPNSATDALLRWDGAFVAGSFSATSSAVYPQLGSDYAGFAERLFVLNGTVPGTTTPVLNNRLYWSDPGGPTTVTDLGQWKDDVSGLVNQLVLPDVGIGLANVSSALAIFCKNSVHVLTGAGNSNFSRKQALNRGATNRDAICTYGEGVYFLSRDGVFYFDGAQERKVSAPVEAKTTQVDGVAMTGYIRDIGNGYLYVGIYDNGTLRWQGLLHTLSGTWGEITFAAVLSGGVQQVAAFNGHVVLLDKARIYNASALTAQVPTATARGRDTNGTTNYAIDTAWTTKTIRLGTPFNKAHVRRVIVDYQWSSASLTPAAWAYRVCTAPIDQSAGTPTVLAQGSLDADGNSTEARRRAVIEVHAEAENLWVELSHNTVSAGKVVAELYDVWVEYDVAQQSRGY